MKSTHLWLISAMAVTASTLASAEMTSEQARRERMDEAYQNYRQSPSYREPGRFERAENAVKHGAHDAGEGIKHGAQKTGEAIQHGAEKTGEAIGKGVRKTGDALHRAGEKMEGSANN